MVRTGPLTGLIVQVVLLVGLDRTIGLDTAGWLAGLAAAVAMCVLINQGLHRLGQFAFGPADWVTLSRASLVVGVAALTVDSLDRPVSAAALVGLTAVALALDGVDGQVARRTGTCSAFGARFDMEVDAFLLLILSLYAVRGFGAWVLAIGGMRYAFVAAMWLAPWMRATLPLRYWRKVVAATQGITLVAATAGVVPRPVMAAALIAALALLVESFGRDVGWLWLRRPVAQPAGKPVPALRPRVEVARVGAGGKS
jgi:phosphatidylglycerophosphate synthase